MIRTSLRLKPGLLDEIVTPDVFTAKTLRSINAFTRDDGTPLNYTLVNLKDWCKTTTRSSTSSASTRTPCRPSRDGGDSSPKRPQIACRFPKPAVQSALPVFLGWTEAVQRKLTFARY